MHKILQRRETHTDLEVSMQRVLTRAYLKKYTRRSQRWVQGRIDRMPGSWLVVVRCARAQGDNDELLAISQLTSGLLRRLWTVAQLC